MMRTTLNRKLLHALLMASVITLTVAFLLTIDTSQPFLNELLSLRSLARFAAMCALWLGFQFARERWFRPEKKAGAEIG